MRIVVADSECFYSDDYTLSKMENEQFTRDPRFEDWGWSFKWQHNIPARWYTPKDMKWLAKNEDWSDVWLICHHMQHDGFILSERYDVHPRMLGCTMAMARLLLGTAHSMSLESLRRRFNLPPKITPYGSRKGKHWNELNESEQQLVADGCCDEVESIWQLFNILGKDFSIEEYEVVDLILKMFTEPRLLGDIDLLRQIWEREDKNKQDRLTALGVTGAQLRSADLFAQLLRDMGIEPETKEGKKETTYAFAKTDPFMRDFLLEHDDPDVRALAEARIGEKSTFMQTRAEALGFKAARGPVQRKPLGGPLPVYLFYAGAGTLRPSGGGGDNWLNFKRNSDIRRSIVAPEGFLCCPIDASQIECRVEHYLAGGPDEPVIQKFRNKEDPYVDLASKFYGEKIYKPKQDDPRRHEMEAKRGMGKQGRLMCGYGAAGKQFKQTAKNGLYGPPVDISIEDADAFVRLYRSDNPSICGKNTGYWAQCSRMLSRLAGGEPCDWRPLHVENHRIYLPNGCALIYDTLEFYRPPEEDWDKYRDFERGGFWRMRTRQGWKTMWGSKLTQNICEALSRVIISQAMIRIHRRFGLRPFNWPYDELLLLIPKGPQADATIEGCLDEMRREVPWLPGLPLDAKATPGDRYSK